ncbi:ribose-phosphate pyrophosphokinase [bacterium]|nr:ribose-phosphate pyrophosphokinase [bacterium]
MNNMKIFSGTSNLPLTRKIVDYLKHHLGQSEIRHFSDGEISPKINESIRGMDVFIIQSTNPPAENLIEFLMMIDAASRASAQRVTAVIPYFGYARQDRKDQPRVSLSAKLVANLISTAGANRILTLDLHSASIQGFFDIPFDHLYSYVMFADHIKKEAVADPVVVAPDIGSVKRARAYANRLNTDLALVDKRRMEPNKIQSVSLIGNVKDRDVILFDDIIDTAGTLCSAADLMRNEGARKILAACTHAILSGDAVERIGKSAISKLFVSDTVFLPDEKKIDKIQVISAAPLFGEAIRRIHNEKSISSLFDI